MTWRRALAAAALLAGAALAPRSARPDALQDVERGVPTVQSLLQLVQQGAKTRAEAPTNRAARKLSEAETFYLLGEWDRASALLREALEDPVFSASTGGDTARFYLGDALRRGGSCPAARPYLQSYLALGPSEHRGEALGAAVDCAARTGDAAALQVLLTQADQIYGPNLPGELRYLSAKAAYGRTELPQAERLARAAEAFGAVPPPYAHQAAYFLGTIEVERGNLPAAVTQFERCVGLPAQDGRQREVQDLCLMALGRVHAERDELPAALDAYGRISVDSPQFEAALYETAWAYLDQGQEEAALRTARNVSELAPEARLAPQAALLEAQVLVRLGRFEEASDAYLKVVTTYGGARDALGSVLDLHEDPVRYLGELVSRRDGPLEVATPVPPVAMRWAAERQDVQRATALAGDVEGGREALEEATGVADRVDAALGRNHGLDAFPDLRETYASAQAVENAAAVLQGQAASVVVEALGPSVDPASRAELDRVHAERLALESKLDALPRTADAAVARLDRLRSRLDAVDRDAFRLTYGAEASDAMITASQVWLESHKDEVRSDGASRAAFDEELRQHRAVVAGYRTELADLQKRIAIARDAAAGTDALQEEGRLRAAYLALLAEERQLLAGARTRASPAALARADRAEQLTDQLEGYAVQARAVGAGAADDAAQRAGAVQAQVARERLILAQQSGALEGVRGEVAGAVGLVAFRAYGEVRKELYGVALEGDVGLTDVAWARKKDRVEKIRTLSAEKADALRALEARYAPVLGEGRVNRLPLAAALLLAPLAASAAAPATGYTSCRVRAPRQAAAAPAPAAPAPAAPVVLPGPDADRAELEASIRRFDEEGRGYRAEAQGLIDRSYDQARRAVADRFDRQLDDVEAGEKGERQSAIARFEEFLRRYPDDPVHSPEAMFRLAELHYEKSNDDFEAAVAAHTEAAQRAVAEGRDPPPEPQKSYARSIALYQKILTGFPGYPFQHGVQYLLAYALGEMGQEEESREAYATLIERYPRSPYVPEAWVRLGDHWFDAVAPDALVRASAAYQQLEQYPDHPLYARAQYKLGWTRYRMDDFSGAVAAFTKLLDHYVAAAAPGEKPGGDVWPEAVQYIAISFADQRGGGVEGARAYYGSLGGRPYEAEIYARLGDVYFDETRWGQAVAAYKAVLDQDPLSPDAPRVQARIVLAWSRDRRFDREAAEREALVAAFSEGSPWYQKNQGDPTLVAAVRDLSEQSLLRAASFHHAQAQQYKADKKLEAAVAEYRVAAKAYGDYVTRFPHSKQAHEMSYRWADCLYNSLEFAQSARVYAAVRDDPASDRYRGEAALSAIIAWEGEITRLQRLGQLEARKVLRSADRKPDEVVKVEPVPGVLQDLVRDSDALMDRAPEQERAPAIAYKAGEVFYQYGDFDEARCRFEEVVSTWPSTPVAQYAANLIIESYLTTRDWANVEAASARLQTAAVGKNKELNASLQKFKLGGRFNRAMQLMEAKQYEPAAATFLALVAEEPKHEFADKALFNAAACYEGARRFESALKLYERIPAEYPKSTLADEALFRVGFNAENTYEFEKAVDRYVQLVNRYPNSKHRKDALYNAARSLENLQRYDEAADAFARYARTYPDAEDAARSQFHAALIYEKGDNPQREIAALQGFVGKFSKTREHELVVQAHLKMGLAYRQAGDHKQAQASYGRAVREFSARGLKPEVQVSAAAAAAEARFRLAEYDFERYDQIKLPATSNTKKLQKALEAKLAEAKKVAPQYDEVMKYKRPDWILAAFYRKAYLLERLAQTLYDAPIPPDVKANEELLAAYQDQLSAAAAPYEEQAVKVYVDAIEQARRLHVKNEWTKKIAESLARYRPNEYPVMKDAKVRMLQEDLSPAPFADTPDGPTRRAPPAPAAGAPVGAMGPAAPGGGESEQVQPAARAAGEAPGNPPATVDAPAPKATAAAGGAGT